MKKHIIIPALSAALMLGACSDTWDDHYTETPAEGSGAPLMEQLKADPELSRFVQMVETAGYSDLLASSQTFTVWAPVNSALESVDLNDKAAVTRTVANHIARFNISSATPSSEGVKMLNGKLLYFADNASTFGGAKLAVCDIHAGNGLIHKLSQQIPYAYNLREYIDTHAETSSISSFLARFDQLIPENQIPGMPDGSADLVDYNRLLLYPDLGLGAIASEDSVFSMAIPTNTAWTAAYNTIKPYFATYDEDPAKADSIQDVQTSLAIVSDLVFRTGRRNPLEVSPLMTTTGSIIANPAAYFAGMQQINASNGFIFLADALNYDMTETFNKPIEIEAEDQSGRTPGGSTTIYTRNVATDNPLASQISGQRYIDVQATQASRQPGVTFQIPNVLAGAYDIYAVFVPASVADPTVTTERTRLQFSLSYRNSNGRNASKSFRNNDFLTSPTEITVIKVAEGFTFPVANYYDRLWSMDPAHTDADRNITTTLSVQTNVTSAEFNRNELVRRFRIDRVYLVPVNPE